jgi:hypothetical protein
VEQVLERGDGVMDDLVGGQDVSLDGEDDAGSWHAVLDRERGGPVVRAREPRAASLQVDDAELATLDAGILLEHLQDQGGLGARPHLPVDQVLVLPGVVDARLRGRHTHPGDHDGLDVHEALRRESREPLLGDAGGGGDDDAARGPSGQDQE